MGLLSAVAKSAAIGFGQAGATLTLQEIKDKEETRRQERLLQLEQLREDRRDARTEKQEAHRDERQRAADEARDRRAEASLRSAEDRARAAEKGRNTRSEAAIRSREETAERKEAAKEKQDQEYKRINFFAGRANAYFKIDALTVDPQSGQVSFDQAFSTSMDPADREKAERAQLAPAVLAKAEEIYSSMKAPSAVKAWHRATREFEKAWNSDKRAEAIAAFTGTIREEGGRAPEPKPIDPTQPAPAGAAQQAAEIRRGLLQSQPVAGAEPAPAAAPPSVMNQPARQIPPAVLSKVKERIAAGAPRAELVQALKNRGFTDQEIAAAGI